MRSLAVALGFLALAHSARAEKKIAFQVTHPAVLTAALAGKVVTPGPLTGDCAKEFGDLVFRDMRAHGLAVAGGADAPAAGTSAIVLSIAVSRCDSRPLPEILGEGLPAVHISRTEGWFAAQMRALDGPSGPEIASLAVRGHAQKENQSQTGNPEWPSPPEVKSLAMRQGIVDARRLYTTWTESRELPFMDSKDCHLKQAFDVAKSGNYAELVKVSRANADACGSGSKAAMEAWYNLGVADWAVRRYDDAVSALQKAADLNGGKLAAGLLDECRQEAAAAKANQPQPAPAAPAAPAQTGILMTNDFVIKLIDGNVANDEVIRMIANQPGRFSFEPADLAKLKAANVPDAVIAAMRNKK